MTESVLDGKPHDVVTSAFALLPMLVGWPSDLKAFRRTIPDELYDEPFYMLERASGKRRTNK